MTKKKEGLTGLKAWGREYERYLQEAEPEKYKRLEKEGKLWQHLKKKDDEFYNAMMEMLWSQTPPDVIMETIHEMFLEP